MDRLINIDSCDKPTWTWMTSLAKCQTNKWNLICHGEDWCRLNHLDETVSKIMISQENQCHELQKLRERVIELETAVSKILSAPNK